MNDIAGSTMAGMGKNLITLGLIFVVLGIVLLLDPKIPWLGKLPGDIHFKKNHVEFYIPIVSCLILSLMLNGVLWLISEWGKR